MVMLQSTNGVCRFTVQQITEIELLQFKHTKLKQIYSVAITGTNNNSDIYHTIPDSNVHLHLQHFEICIKRMIE